jgi:hypothetical protein
MGFHVLNDRPLQKKNKKCFEGQSYNSRLNN